MEQDARLEVTRLSGSGPSRRKLLIVGDAALVAPGAGERSSRRSLSPALVGRSTVTEARGLDIDVLSNLIPALKAIGGASASWRLWRYDAVVIVVGAASATFGALLLQRLLLRAIADLAGAGRLVLVLASPVSRGQSGRASRRWSARLLQRLRVQEAEVPALTVDLDEDGRLADAAGVADDVLELLAAVPVKDAVPAHERRDEPQDEGQRQVAVDRSLHALQGSTTDLERVVLLARNSFDVPYAQVNLVSRGRLRSLAFAGRSSDSLVDTLSAVAVRQDGGLLVPDTHEDRRFDGIPETRGPEAIRFYAGYPIESLDGYRIGVLCVLDTQPHPIVDGDDVLLRDVALLAEAELNALVPAAG